MKKFILLLASFFVAVATFAGSGGSSKVTRISHAELTAAVDQKSAVIIDVNGSKSFKKGRIPGAIDYIVSKAELAKFLPADKNALIVAYCGNEQCPAYKTAADAAVRLGYTNVRHYAPGIEGWIKSGAKVEKS